MIEGTSRNGYDPCQLSISRAAGHLIDAHQDRLQVALETSGDGWLTTTRLRGATYLRAGIVNYLATEADIDRLLATLRRLAADAA